MRLNEKMEVAENAVEQICKTVDECCAQIRSSLAELLSSMSGKDWQSDGREIMQRDEDLNTKLSHASSAIDNLRRFIADASDGAGRLMRITSELPSAPPTLKEAVESLVIEYEQERLSAITLDKALQDLREKGLPLSVKNPAAVVASILVRHPRLSKREMGVYLLTSNLDINEDRSDEVTADAVTSNLTNGESH